MSEEKTENDLSEWLSTYGLITAERILERYKIRLQPEDLASAIKSPNTFYHRVLHVPLKNVLNGIILQQANDYQVYAQKLFIDYLLSGETSKSEDSPGGFTREDLEKERQELIRIGEAFHEQELVHNNLIAESQRSLMKLTEQWHKVLANVARDIKKALQAERVSASDNAVIQAINILLIMYDFTQTEDVSLKGESWSRVEKILGQTLNNEARQKFVDQMPKLRDFMLETEPSFTAFMDKIGDMTAKLRDFRSQFYNLILRTNELIKVLPEFHFDPAQTEENKESLLFDAAIGEQS
ncbi:Uncharacterised protein [Legionella lansingensis]|uniref:Uncharacterized protein n=1 Tax=Legionella lansingensis TaxID=45067 RepID=A0A0W0VSL8_9GAMM|nr:hypothetical protein [Legionella lansingensis]KTD23090.1 hypothetical protein Llan_0928 [Legionella lansingensis]SNV51205.1 Uncharacterised protein [Legionella lansingensis]